MRRTEIHTMNKPAKTMNTKKPAKKSASKTAVVKAGRTARKPAVAETPSRPPTKPGRWAFAAYVAVRSLVERLELAQSNPDTKQVPMVGNWNESEAGAARTLYLRFLGRDVHPADEITKGGGHFPKPAGFVSWAKALRELEDVAVWLPMEKLRQRKHAQGPWCIGACRVSPYAVVIADDEAHPLFDSRGRWKPTMEFVRSLTTWGGNFDAIKLKPISETGKHARKGVDGVLYVEDGRQRVNGVRVANAATIIIWYADALRNPYDKVALERLIDVDDEGRYTGLIELMSAEIKGHSIREAQAMAAASNNQRRQDQVIHQAERAAKMRAPTKCDDGEELPGYHQHEIAEILGVSRQTVANLLLLQDLRPELWVPLRSGDLPITCGYMLAVLDHEKQAALWARIEPLPSERKAEALRALIAGREPETTPAPKPRAMQEVEKMRARLDTLEGNGPLVARAVLDYVLGRCGPEVFREFPDELQQQFRMPTVGAAPEASTPLTKGAAGKKGGRQKKGWGAYNLEEIAAWEAVGVFDSINAHLLETACISTVDAAKLCFLGSDTGTEGRKIGEAVSLGKITIAEAKTLLRQLELPSSEAV